MSALFQRLVCDLPERHAPGKNSFAIDAKSLRSWITHLPLANPGATARLLIGALRETNQLRLDPLQRLDALELLRLPISEIICTLDKQILADSFPLPPQKRQMGQLAQDFEHELALGYAAVVYDLCSPAGAVPFLRGKAATLALIRAIQHRGAYLYQAYLLYHAPPVGAWQNLHDLFRFAVAVHADDKALDDALCGNAQISVRMAYIHALLLALCNPYRFTQRENSLIFGLTQIWAMHCQLREGRAPAGSIAIRTDRDQSLGYLPEERESPGDGLWALEISALQRFLEGQLAMLPPGVTTTQFRLKGGPTLTVDVGFVERLMHVWDNGSERTQQRLAAGHHLDSVIGMHDLHYVLAGNQDFETFLRKIRGVAISLHEGDRVASWAASPANGPPKVKHLPVKVLDQSLGGYRLVWDKLDGMRVKVGELLGLAPLADDGEAQDWMIGAIRWLRIEPSGALDAGVELLARRALPVGLRSFDEQNVPRSAMRGVLLETLNDTDDDSANGSSILTPHLFDREAREIELTRPADPFGWPAEAVVETLGDVSVCENGGGYLRIDIAHAPKASATSSPPSAANDDLPPPPVILRSPQ